MSVCEGTRTSLSCFALTHPLLPAWPMCVQFVTPHPSALCRIISTARAVFLLVQVCG